MTGNVPSCVGVTMSVRRDPRDGVLLHRHSGTQKEWMTSFDVISNSTVWSMGRTSSPVVSGLRLDLDVRVRERPRELLAVTSTTRWSAGTSSDWASATPRVDRRCP